MEPFWKNEDQISNEILRFYEALYTILQLTNGDHLGHWKTSAVEDQWLQRPFDEDEILGVIKKLQW